MGPAHLLRMARASEELGFDSVWVRDHLIVSPLEMSRFQQRYLDGGRPVVSGRYLSCVPALTAVATITARVSIGTDIINIPRRHPVDVANEMAAVDEISGGRLIVQGAIGHPTRDWEPLGIESSLRARGEMLEEAMAIMRALWTSEEPIDFAGRHYTLRQARIGSRPVQRPGPPIWLGVEKTLGRVARLADGFTLMGTMFGGDLEHFRAAVREVRRQAAAAGRDPGAIVAAARFAVVVDLDGVRARRRADADWAQLWGQPQAWYRRWAGDPDEVAAVIAPYVDAGATHVMLWPIPYAGAEALRDLEIFATEVIPRLRARAVS
jgi:alkanesulfonate monooxygenase SsuD/methylene tetrahydromethanopterin reductase-like flavin-dependent oxidoreductase (luciferase family)